MSVRGAVSATDAETARSLGLVSHNAQLHNALYVPRERSTLTGSLDNAAAREIPSEVYHATAGGFTAPRNGPTVYGPEPAFRALHASTEATVSVSAETVPGVLHHGWALQTPSLRPARRPHGHPWPHVPAHLAAATQAAAPAHTLFCAADPHGYEAITVARPGGGIAALLAAAAATPPASALAAAQLHSHPPSIPALAGPSAGSTCPAAPAPALRASTYSADAGGGAPLRMSSASAASATGLFSARISDGAASGPVTASASDVLVSVAGPATVAAAARGLAVGIASRATAGARELPPGCVRDGAGACAFQCRCHTHADGSLCGGDDCAYAPQPDTCTHCGGRQRWRGDWRGCDCSPAAVAAAAAAARSGAPVAVNYDPRYCDGELDSMHPRSALTQGARWTETITHKPGAPSIPDRAAQANSVLFVPPVELSAETGGPGRSGPGLSAVRATVDTRGPYAAASRAWLYTEEASAAVRAGRGGGSASGDAALHQQRRDPRVQGLAPGCCEGLIVTPAPITDQRAVVPRGTYPANRACGCDDYHPSRLPHLTSPAYLAAHPHLRGRRFTASPERAADWAELGALEALLSGPSRAALERAQRARARGEDPVVALMAAADADAAIHTDPDAEGKADDCASVGGVAGAGCAVCPPHSFTARVHNKVEHRRSRLRVPASVDAAAAGRPPSPAGGRPRPPAEVHCGDCALLGSDCERSECPVAVAAAVAAAEKAARAAAKADGAATVRYRHPRERQFAEQFPPAAAAAAAATDACGSSRCDGDGDADGGCDCCCRCDCQGEVAEALAERLRRGLGQVYTGDSGSTNSTVTSASTAPGLAAVAAPGAGGSSVQPTGPAPGRRDRWGTWAVASPADAAAPGSAALVDAYVDARVQAAAAGAAPIAVPAAAVSAGRPMDAAPVSSAAPFELPTSVPSGAPASAAPSAAAGPAVAHYLRYDALSGVDVLVALERSAYGVYTPSVVGWTPHKCVSTTASEATEETDPQQQQHQQLGDGHSVSDPIYEGVPPWWWAAGDASSSTSTGSRPPEGRNDPKQSRHQQHLSRFPRLQVRQCEACAPAPGPIRDTDTLFAPCGCACHGRRGAVSVSFGAGVFASAPTHAHRHRLPAPAQTLAFGTPLLVPPSQFKSAAEHLASRAGLHDRIVKHTRDHELHHRSAAYADAVRTGAQRACAAGAVRKVLAAHAAAPPPPLHADVPADAVLARLGGVRAHPAGTAEVPVATASPLDTSTAEDEALAAALNPQPAPAQTSTPAEVHATSDAVPAEVISAAPPAAPRVADLGPTAVLSGASAPATAGMVCTGPGIVGRLSGPPGAPVWTRTRTAAEAGHCADKLASRFDSSAAGAVGVAATQATRLGPGATVYSSTPTFTNAYRPAQSPLSPGLHTAALARRGPPGGGVRAAAAAEALAGQAEAHAAAGRADAALRAAEAAAAAAASAAAAGSAVQGHRYVAPPRVAYQPETAASAAAAAAARAAAEAHVATERAERLAAEAARAGTWVPAGKGRTATHRSVGYEPRPTVAGGAGVLRREVGEAPALRAPSAAGAGVGGEAGDEEGAARATYTGAVIGRTTAAAPTSGPGAVPGPGRARAAAVEAGARERRSSAVRPGSAAAAAQRLTPARVPQPVSSFVMRALPPASVAAEMRARRAGNAAANSAGEKATGGAKPAQAHRSGSASAASVKAQQAVKPAAAAAPQAKPAARSGIPSALRRPLPATSAGGALSPARGPATKPSGAPAAAATAAAVPAASPASPPLTVRSAEPTGVAVPVASPVPVSALAPIAAAAPTHVADAAAAITPAPTAPVPAAVTALASAQEPSVIFAPGPLPGSISEPLTHDTAEVVGSAQVSPPQVPSTPPPNRGPSPSPQQSLPSPPLPPPSMRRLPSGAGSGGNSTPDLPLPPPPLPDRPPSMLALSVSSSEITVPVDIAALIPRTTAAAPAPHFSALRPVDADALTAPSGAAPAVSPHPAPISDAPPGHGEGAGATFSYLDRVPGQLAGATGLLPQRPLSAYADAGSALPDPRPEPAPQQVTVDAADGSAALPIGLARLGHLRDIARKYSSAGPPPSAAASAGGAGSAPGPGAGTPLPFAAAAASHGGGGSPLALIDTFVPARPAFTVTSPAGAEPFGIFPSSHAPVQPAQVREPVAGTLPAPAMTAKPAPRAAAKVTEDGGYESDFDISFGSDSEPAAPTPAAARPGLVPPQRRLLPGPALAGGDEDLLGSAGMPRPESPGF